MRWLPDTLPHPVRRLIQTALALLLVLLALAGLIRWWLPGVVADQIRQQGSAALGRTVTLESLQLNPWNLTASLKGLAIAGASDAPGPLLTLAEATINLSSSSLWQRAVVVEALSLNGVVLDLGRRRDGTLELDDVMQTLAQRPDDGGQARFALANLSLRDGRIRVRDDRLGQVHEVDQLALDLPFLSSLPRALEIEVTPHLSGRIDDAEFRLEGRALPFSARHSSVLDVELRALPIAPFLVGLPLPLSIETGNLTTALQLQFEIDEQQQAQLRAQGQIIVRQLQASDRAGGPTRLSIAEAGLTGLTADVLESRLTSGTLSVNGVRGRVARDAEGRFDLPTARRSSTPAKAPSPSAGNARSLELKLDAVQLSDVRVDYRDAGLKLEQSLQIDTLEVGAVRLAQGRIDPFAARASARLPGLQDKAMAVALDADPHQNRFKGSVSLPVTQLRPVAPAALALASIRLDDGRIQGELGFEADLPRKTWQLDLTQAAVRSLRLAHSNSRSEVKLGELVLSGTRLASRDAGLPAVTLAKADWKELDLSHQPAQAPRPLAFTRLEGSLQSVSWNHPALSATLKLRGRTPERGRLSIEGTVQGTGSLVSRATIRLDGVAIPPWLAVVPTRFNADLATGVVDARGQLDLSLDASMAPIKLHWKGDAGLREVQARDTVNDVEFLSWRRLQMPALDVRWGSSSPLALDVGTVSVDGLYGRLILNAQGRLNVADLVRAPGDEARSITTPAPVAAPVTQAASAPTPAPAASTAAAAGPRAHLRLAGLTITDSSLNFTDQFIQPNYRVNLTQIAGSVSALAWDDPKPATLKLAARVDDSAPVTIEGTLHPLGAQLQTDIRAQARGVELPALTPYAAKWAGYAIERGKLSVDLRYVIQEGRLQAENRVVLDQLTFGDRVESPNATKLPVLLAVSLLKDRNGQIDINLPISGSLSDPEFSVGGIVVRVIVNLIVKAVTSPFALLAGAFGGDEAQASHVAFAPGLASLSESASRQVQTLAKALTDRPALRLEVAGVADQGSDLVGLRRVWLDAQIAKAGSLREAYRAAELPNRPRNLIGLTKRLPDEEMERLMLAAAPVNRESLLVLAESRAQAVVAALREQGLSERVYTLRPQVLDAATQPKDSALPPARVDLSLR